MMNLMIYHHPNYPLTVLFRGKIETGQEPEGISFYAAVILNNKRGQTDFVCAQKLRLEI